MQTIPNVSLTPEMLAQILAAAGAKAPVNVGNMMVGLRNKSNLTVGLTGSPTPNEGDVQMAPEAGGIISYAWWRVLRQGKLVRNGILVRDDVVLGPVDTAAPADRPEDLPPEAVTNLIDDPFVWIAARSEAELRRDIAALSSAASVRKLQFAVDQAVQRKRDELGCDGSKRSDNIVKEKLAATSLPMSYQLVQQLTEERLYELSPVPDIEFVTDVDRQTA